MVGTELTPARDILTELLELIVEHFKPTLKIAKLEGDLENFFDELSAAQEAGILHDVTHKRISKKYGIEWLE